MARKRRFNTFSLSFLDIMSCGFGAVALVFLIIKHETTRVPPPEDNILAEANMLAEDIREGEKELVLARNIVSDLDERQVQAEGLARRIIKDTQETATKIEAFDSEEAEDVVQTLEQEIETLLDKIKKVEATPDGRGRSVLNTPGNGRRQYLNGLRMDGGRNLILLDASASMTANTPSVAVVNKYRPDNVKRNAEKWRRAVGAVKWLVANLPQESRRFQIYAFNVDYESVIPGTENTWLELSDPEIVEQAITNLDNIVPNAGTSLEVVFSSIVGFGTLPDNIYLITDGLPTQGLVQPKKNTVSSKEREELFYEAIEILPPNVPVNIILLPMKGDINAPDAYWRLAQLSRGTLFSPTSDWPSLQDEKESSN